MAKLDEGLPVELRTVRTRPLFVMRLDVKGPLVVGGTVQRFPAHWHRSRRFVRWRAAVGPSPRRRQRLASGPRRRRDDVGRQTGPEDG